MSSFACLNLLVFYYFFWLTVEHNNNPHFTRFSSLTLFFLQTKITTPRGPIGLTNSNIIPYKDFSPYLRGKIIGKLKEGKKPAYIAKELKIAKSTIQDTIKNDLIVGLDGRTKGPLPLSGRKQIEARKQSEASQIAIPPFPTFFYTSATFFYASATYSFVL